MRGALVVGLGVLASCGGSGNGSFVLNHGIVDGQSQVVIAGATRLENRVAWQLARNESGRITLKRVVDPLLPSLAYAQSTKAVVKGSPVAGAVVCATEGELKPFVPCTNTDANGMATFFYDVKTTKAGEYKSEIRGTLNGEPAVFDTVKATVETGPLEAFIVVDRAYIFASGPKVGVSAFINKAEDRYGNPVTTKPTISTSGAFGATADSIFSDATERRDIVSFTQEAKQASVVVSSILDLRTKAWRMSGRCGPMNGFQKGNASVDSVTFSLNSQSITYMTAWAGDAYVKTSWIGSETFYLVDKSTLSESTQPIEIGFDQKIDSIGSAALDTASPFRRYVMTANSYCVAHPGFKGSYTITEK